MKAIYTNNFTDTQREATVLRHEPGAGAPQDRRSRGSRSAAAQAGDVPTALLAQCTCPDWCERDHDRD